MTPTTYSSVEAFNADTNKRTLIPSEYVAPLLTLTRRPLEVDGNTVRAKFTPWREIELAAVDSTPGFDAWVLGTIEIAGKLIEFAVYLGKLFEVPRIGRVFRSAQIMIAEVISSGSRAARFLGEGTAIDGHRVLLYSATELDPAAVAQALAAFVARHGVELPAEPVKPTKKAGKAKAA